MNNAYYKDLGVEKDYEDTLRYQLELQKELINNQRKESAIPGYLLFLEHPHIYTIGKSGKPQNMLISQEQLKKINATFVKTTRGGDITYHGPGQLVGYPILDLNLYKPDIHWYMRRLEEVFILLLADYGIVGERSNKETGVWLDVGKSYSRKILQLGVKLTKWVTLHGFSFNANVDLSYFDYIVPCGIKGKAVTSLSKELGREIPMPEIKEKSKKYFSQVFDTELLTK